MAGKSQIYLCVCRPDVGFGAYGAFVMDGAFGSTSSFKIKYELKHDLCDKFVVYFVSRIAIVYNPAKNRQAFYQGHRMRISTLARHPTEAIIATGEVNQSPEIHLWNANTMETLAILRTAHRGGVLHLEFSRDGSQLVSIGMDISYSMQIFNWRQERVVAFRNLGK